MHSRDISHLSAICDAAEKILRYTIAIQNPEQLYLDEKTLDAVLMNFVVIGESASKLNESLTSENPEIPWKSIKRFRNIIAHDYFGVDPEAVWQIIANHLPLLVTNVRRILDEEE